MPKQKELNAKRIRSLVIVCTLTAIVLSVSTYAWFIGMRTVNVSSFDVEIAATDSLLLSLNGADWDTTVNISQSTLNAVSYAGHTNNWGGEGLFPVSSVGEMDTVASRMKLFEKASLTTTKGGYRLMASRVNNYATGDPERDGYVVFDLFVRNFSGNQYLEALNTLDEEAIYLTLESAVTVAEGGVADTGIENSVRVAFAQIGRVSGFTTDAGKITGITCEPDDTTKLPTIKNGVTGICRTAQIWEPNDKAHVDDAIRWYETSCLKRTGDDVTLAASYGTPCGSVIDGKSYPTYAIKSAIASSDNVDIYDGPAYNTYEPELPEDNLLYAYPYFTDTMKRLTGTSRPTFMTFAPNSITKVRVYIYIEGQDVDNYDFASIGKKISVKFGFTKERYTENDIEYNGPDLNEGDGPLAADLTDPVVSVTGANPMNLAVGATYEELGATATDNKDTAESLLPKIVTSGTVDTSQAGTYTINYTVVDAAGNTGVATRTIIVE